MVEAHTGLMRDSDLSILIQNSLLGEKVDEKVGEKDYWENGQIEDNYSSENNLCHVLELTTGEVLGYTVFQCVLG